MRSLDGLKKETNEPLLAVATRWRPVSSREKYEGTDHLQRERKRGAARCLFGRTLNDDKIGEII
jgi:hypothetical protein